MVDYNLNTENKSLGGGINELADNVVFFDNCDWLDYNDLNKVPENVKNAITDGFNAGRLPLVVLRNKFKLTPCLYNVNDLNSVRFIFVNNDDYNTFLCFIECNLKTNTCGSLQYKNMGVTFE